MPEIEQKQTPLPEGQEEPRIAVYTCYCGGNISEVVDCEKVAEAVSRIPNVVISRTDMSMCSDAGQALIEQDIREHGVNRVIVGACAPSLHETTFRGAVTRAGLNPYLYNHVGIREQDSWVHHDNPEGATEKAIRLLAAGIAKSRMLEPLEPIKLNAEQHALVIGGGIAGLRAALDIARRGIKATLVEKTPFLGGRMAQLETTFPADEPAREALHRLIDQVVAHPNITIYTQAEVVSMHGYVGDFHAEIRQNQRGVSEDIADAAMQACEIEVPDEYNYGLTTRKVIYRAYDGCYPPAPAVDWANCPDGRLELTLDGEPVILENRPETIDLTVGAIVVATGFDLYEPREGEYGYGTLPEVITLPQFIRLLALTGDAPLEWNGRRVKNMAVVHCVGSREIDGIHEPHEDGRVNEYCSRICCSATLHTLNTVRDRYPDINIFDAYEDIRTYGRGHEDMYIKASKQAVRFLRFHNEERPKVTGANGDQPALVTLNDYLTWGEEIEVPVDLVVLAVGVKPRAIDDLISMLKISKGSDRFLAEVHPKLRPVETAVPGIVLAGTAQGPMNIQESSAAASAAAAKVSVLLASGEVQLEPFVAVVNHDLCDGTGACVEVCCYEDAIALETFTVDGIEVQKAVVTPANCVGCGVCVSACPNRAIDVQGWTLAQYDAMIDAIVGELPTLEAAQ